MTTLKVENLNLCNICGGTAIESIDPGYNFCKCKDCGYIFDNPRPTQQEIWTFYSKPMQYDAWLSREKEREVLWKRRIKKMRKHLRSGSLLDVGTGTGQFLNLARHYYTQVVGTEVSKSAIAIAKEKYNLDVAEGDIIDAVLPTGSVFDNVSMFHVLEHVPNPRQVIARCHSLMCQEGILTIAVPNDVMSIRIVGKTRIKKILGRCGVGRFKNVSRLGLPSIALNGSLDEIHLSHFTPAVLRRLLEGSGFEIVENSLDPFYVAGGIRALLHRVYYLSMTLLKFLLKNNYYETIWVVARKK